MELSFKKRDDTKLRVLFKGWTRIPHSYSQVNCFQLIHLYKHFSDKIEIYVDEQPYFRPEWNNKRKLVYPKDYNEIIENLKVWNGSTNIDVVYSITYPYNISEVVINGRTIPKCIFYTAEFSCLDTTYFNTKFATDAALQSYINSHQEFFFTAPSIWSANGLVKYNVPDKKNKVITHGVDTDIFKLSSVTDRSKRDAIRKFYKVKDNEILMINIGAMTQNKGIVLVLQVLNELVHKYNKEHYKLLLKGTGDLYDSQKYLEAYLHEFVTQNIMTSEQRQNLLDYHIIFTDKTFGYDMINDMFNAADLYISPYIAEGFNLTVLESLSAGLPVLVPNHGSTREYIEDIYNNGGQTYIKYVDCRIGTMPNGFCQNMIDINNLVDVMITSEDHFQTMKKNRFLHYNNMRSHIEQHYSWKTVAGLLYEYLFHVYQTAK